MADAGVHIAFAAQRLAVVGLTEVFARLPDILKGMRIARDMLRSRRPRLLILIDFPEFNLKVAAAAKRQDIPVLYYISPQVWAWRRRRAKRISRLVDRMAVILPFEERFYRPYRLPVSFVGHPLLDQPQEPGRPADASEPADSVTIGLLPGSRMKEVQRHLPVMLEAAERIAAKRAGQVRVLVSLAPEIDRSRFEAIVAARRGRAEVLTVEGGADRVYRNCRLAVAVSGTVTLEAALSATPMVIIYRVSRTSYLLGKRLIKVPHIGLINLIAEREVVPELIQDDVNPGRIADTVERLLNDESRLAAMRSALEALRDRFGGPGASRRVARIAFEMMAEEETGALRWPENGRI